MFCVCYTCDDNYSVQVGVAIYSLYDQNRDLDQIDTIIFSAGISEENRKNLIEIANTFHRELVFIESSEIIEYISEKGIKASVDGGALSTYVRLFIWDYIDRKYQRVIYIDADTMVIGSIRKLVEKKMCLPVAAVIDIMPYSYREVLGMEDSYYFNCGVLVIDSEKWRKGNYKQRLFNEAMHPSNHYMYGDQDVFNLVLKDSIEVLPMSFNFFPFYGRLKYDNLRIVTGKEAKYYSREEYEESKNKPIIVHMVYSVADRPWIVGNKNEFAEKWMEYVGKTPWKTIRLKTRKWYSRTRVMQLIHALFGEKMVVRIESFRNKRKIAKTMGKRTGND